MARTVLVSGILLAFLCTFSMGQLIVTATDDPDVLANEILGSGITIVPGSPSFLGGDGRSIRINFDPDLPVYGNPYSAGTFAGGLGAGIGIGSGIILTTGDVTQAVGPNTLDNTMTVYPYLSGDADLDALLPANPPYTQETTFLELQFETTSGNVSFNFVFASEEYNEYAYTGVNDIFGLFVDGENVALIPGTSTPVSIDTVNGGGGYFDNNPACPYGSCAQNPQFYNNNDLSDGGGAFDIEYDGFTHVFTATKLGLGPGVHTLKLAIADVGDKQVDSAVFIEADSLTDEPHAEFLTCNCSNPGLFDPPADSSKTLKKGTRAVPLKFELCDADGLPVTGIFPPVAQVSYIGPGTSFDFPEESVQTVGQAVPGNSFVLVGDGWHLNLLTKMLTTPGIYEITAVSSDPENYVIDPTCSLLIEIPE